MAPDVALKYGLIDEIVGQSDETPVVDGDEG
jgi:ATP-dependent protease ClpP protease subunit